MDSDWDAFDPPRPLTSWEELVLRRLAPDSARDALAGLRVTEKCNCGCASIAFGDGEHVLLAEGESEDSDGMHIWLLLFGSDDGRQLIELEVQRADGLPIRELPLLDAIRVLA